MTDNGSLARRLPVAVVLVAACFAAYWGWLGWDSEYQTDPVTGQTSGPYESWQVVGCVLTLAGTAVAAGLLGYGVVAVAVMPLAFTVAWSIPASSDETGLWGVGAFMILIGATVGGAVLALPAQAVGDRFRSR
ncbi:hypothetical protein [Motilibacter deserti]|uniref:Uncharacterized protein n=1 Tax=Motilibacter deserti TaxID=2714956 RepID=A0ABX0GV59_9ACTN|nr:hypothetical protein [Motilibacter deserti]NHC14809.1 hypothetical protein [Motilibacter deserti]